MVADNALGRYQQPPRVYSQYTLATQGITYTYLFLFLCLLPFFLHHKCLLQFEVLFIFCTLSLLSQSLLFLLLHTHTHTQTNKPPHTHIHTNHEYYQSHEAVREHVILHSVNVNSKIQTWRMVCMFSILTLRNYKPNYFGHETPPTTICKRWKRRRQG